MNTTTVTEKPARTRLMLVNPAWPGGNAYVEYTDGSTDTLTYAEWLAYRAALKSGAR